MGSFSGWDVVPVDLRGKAGEVLPRYYFLCVSGRCGPIQHGPKTVDRVFPARVVPFWKGLSFDPATWDGTDMFVTDGKGYKFVVEAVRDAFQKAKVKNVEFEALDEHESWVMKADR